MWRSESGARWRPATCLARCLLALSLVWLSGCAIAPPQPSPPAGVSDETNGPREWAGRFSVLVQDDGFDGRRDGAVGRFHLSSAPSLDGRTLALELTSPFGQLLASGRRLADGRSTLSLANGRTLEAPSLDAVLEQALGWPLPIERLPDWLDDRFEQVLERDGQGQVVSASDSGWRIEREPGRWALERARPAGRLRVVLVLDR
jgi:outer membrane lipoprotein LolB